MGGPWRRVLLHVRRLGDLVGTSDTPVSDQSPAAGTTVATAADVGLDATDYVGRSPVDEAAELEATGLPPAPGNGNRGRHGNGNGR